MQEVADLEGHHHCAYDPEEGDSRQHIEAGAGPDQHHRTRDKQHEIVDQKRLEFLKNVDEEGERGGNHGQIQPGHESSRYVTRCSPRLA